MRLTENEKDLIRRMCFIAGVQGRDITTEEGEGDYQGWTEEMFATAERIVDKMNEAPSPKRRRIVGRSECEECSSGTERVCHACGRRICSLCAKDHWDSDDTITRKRCSGQRT